MLTSWNRYQVGRVILGLILTWLIGAVGLYLVEGRANPGFFAFSESLWSVWLLLFGGLDQSFAPKTATGRFLAMFLLVAGVGLAGLFTASVASLLVERYLRRRDVSHFEMDDHLVLCNWAPRGLEWIREVHSKIITEPRPIVIIHDNPDEIDLPDKQDEPAFNDVYIVKGDPTNEVILHRATVGQGLLGHRPERRPGGEARRRQVDPDLHRDPPHLPGRAVSPNIVVECHNPSNRHHLLKAVPARSSRRIHWGCACWPGRPCSTGCPSSTRSCSPSAATPTRSSWSRPPKSWSASTSPSSAQRFLHYRNDRRSCLLIGIQRGDEMMLNPINDEAGPLQSHDQLILLSRIYPSGSQPLPISPAVRIGEEARNEPATPPRRGGHAPGRDHRGPAPRSGRDPPLVGRRGGE